MILRSRAAIPAHTRTRLSKLYVRSSKGPLVPLDSVVKRHAQVGPLSVNHFGQLPAVTFRST